MSYILLDIRKARSLSGKRWTIDGIEYLFGDHMSEGGEAYVYPLLDANGKTTAFLRFLKPRFANRKRIERTAWLIGQKLHEATDVFLGAPSAWVSTKVHGRPSNFHCDFTATFHKAVDGMSWTALKERVQYEGEVLPSLTVRKEFAKHLIAHLATLEVLKMVHGDVSGGNFLVNPRTGEAYLIDFDAFVFKGSETLMIPQLSIADGGVKGTPGYMPSDLENTKSKNAAPYCDRHARDILLVELLAIRNNDPCDVSPRFWKNSELTWKNLEPSANELGLTHLLDPNFFALKSHERPSSRELAIAASCSMPALKLNEEPTCWYSRLWQMHRFFQRGSCHG